MDSAMLIAIIFCLVGVLDRVVVPRILLQSWKKQDQELQPSQIQIIQILRMGGSVLILVGIAVYILSRPWFQQLLP